MVLTVARKLVRAHLVCGQMTLPVRRSGCAPDQTPTQDATGTMVILELEALDLDRVRTEASVQYVDPGRQREQADGAGQTGYCPSGERRHATRLRFAAIR